MVSSRSDIIRLLALTLALLVVALAGAQTIAPSAIAPTEGTVQSGGVTSLTSADTSRYVMKTSVEPGSGHEVASFLATFYVAPGTPSAVLRGVTGIPANGAYVQVWLYNPTTGNPNLGSVTMPNPEGVVEYAISGSQLAQYCDPTTGRLYVHFRMYRPSIAGTGTVTWSTDQLVMLTPPPPEVQVKADNGGGVSGKSVPCTITLTSAATQAVTFSLTSSGPLGVPSSVSLPAGQLTATFNATAGSVQNDEIAQLNVSWLGSGGIPAGTRKAPALVAPLRVSLSALRRKPAEVTVELTPNAAADWYECEVRQGQGAWSLVGRAAVPTFSDPDPRTDGATYRVRGQNSAGYGPYSEEVVLDPAQALPAPSGLRATSIGRQVLLAWKEVPGATGYVVERASGTSTVAIESSSVTLLDSAAPPMVPLSYTVRALDSVAGTRSVRSAAIQVTISVAGAEPTGDLVLGADQRIYGVTSAGGLGGAGTVYQLIGPGQVSSLSFDPLPPGGVNASGANPYTVSSLNGTLFVASKSGGDGSGTLVRIDPNGAIAVAPPIPYDELTVGPNGRLYGVGRSGGAYGGGCVFSFGTDGVAQVLYSFPSSTDSLEGFSAVGMSPAGGLTWDAASNCFVGTTSLGGSYGTGTVYRLSLAGVMQVLASLPSPESATPVLVPVGRITKASDGALYGISKSGGSNGGGSVYRVDLSGAVTIVYSFDLLGDGPVGPNGTLIAGTDGLYGTTSAGGLNGSGTIFRISGGQVTIAYAFTGGADGHAPTSALTLGADGAFYGAARGGGGSGLIYKFAGGTLTPVYVFKDGF